jgi:predicted NAD/FAD-binding protein
MSAAVFSVLRRAAAPAFAVHFLRLALHVGMASAQEQATWRTDASADQAEIGRGVE